MRNYYRVSHLTWYIMYLLCISLRMLPFFITLCRSVSVKRTHVNSFYWHNEAVWKLNWKIIHHPWFCWPAVFNMYPGPRGFSWFPLAWNSREASHNSHSRFMALSCREKSRKSSGTRVFFMTLEVTKSKQAFFQAPIFHIPQQNITPYKAKAP